MTIESFSLPSPPPQAASGPLARRPEALPRRRAEQAIFWPGRGKPAPKEEQMHKSQLVSALSDGCNIPHQQADRAVAAFFSCIEDGLING